MCTIATVCQCHWNPSAHRHFINKIMVMIIIKPDDNWKYQIRPECFIRQHSESWEVLHSNWETTNLIPCNCNEAKGKAYINKGNILFILLFSSFFTLVHSYVTPLLPWCYTKHHIPLTAARQSELWWLCGVKRKYYQNCSVLDCVTQCSQSAAHLYEQFLWVQQIGFVTLGPLHCV